MVNHLTASAVDVAIIGAGPYGLALAAHLRKRGIDHRIFGRPMHTWRSMSPGMYLKSLGFATNIYTPQRHFTLPEYCLARGLEEYEPIKIATFADYGVWVQQHLVSYVEETAVTTLEGINGQFVLTLETGERVAARRVVVAAGLTYFERMPELFADLPQGLVSHSAQHGDFAPFAGRDVTVIGAGQSALQAAALLHEHGAQVRLVARQSVVWSGHVAKHQKRSVRERLRRPNSVLGHGRRNWVLQHAPMLMHHVSDEKRVQFTRTHLGPSGAWWLRDRVEGKIPIHEQTAVLRATARDNRVSLRVREDGTGERDIVTDHVIAGTGYQVDVDRVAFIDADLARSIRRIERAPALSRHFESSVRGLYFIGPASAASFGPLFRFVAGAAYTVPVVARHLAWSSDGVASRWIRPIRSTVAMGVSADNVSAHIEP